MILEIDESPVKLVIDFDYTPQQPDFFDKGHGNYLPGDPAQVTINHVWVGVSNGRQDILSSLSGGEVSKIEKLCLEDGEVQYEDQA